MELPRSCRPGQFRPPHVGGHQLIKTTRRTEHQAAIRDAIGASLLHLHEAVSC